MVQSMELLNQISQYSLKSCPICSASSFKPMFNLKSKFPVVRCSACHFVTLNPQPSDDELAKIYSEDYYLLERTQEGEASFRELKERTAQHYLDLIEKYSGGTKGQLLEIGCGEGDFTKCAADSGFAVSAVEYNPAAVKKAQLKLGNRGKVYCGEIDILNDMSAIFDICVLSDVIEHVRYPREFLAKVYRLLKPNGILFVACPSLDSFSARLQGQHWVEYKPEHLHYFSSETLKTLLTECHFANFQEQDGAKTLSIEYIASHFEKFPVPYFSALSKVAVKFIPARVKKHPFKIVASGMINLSRKV
jgi:2-polyprenyl-3-methyl-5-hydroxy-6-metoxy-1,4-benzoquinol methylase